MTQRNYHSRWACPKCGRIYQSPLTGTREVSHKCPKTLKGERFVRKWRSRYDALK